MTSRSDEHLRDIQQGRLSTREPGESLINQELGLIIPVIASVMAKQVRATSCSFYIYDQEADRTVAVFRHGDAKLKFPKPADSDYISPRFIPIEAEILANGASIRRSRPDDFVRWPMIHHELRENAEGYTDLVVPLRRAGKINGVVYLWRQGSPGPFTDEELRTAERLTDIAAMAVEFARQYGVERARRVHLNALLNVATLAASHLTVDDVLPPVTQLARSAAEADVCNLYVFEPDGDLVSSSYSSGLNDREQWVFNLSETYPVEKVPCEISARRTLAPVIVRDFERELAPESDLISYTSEAQISEILVVPIVYQETMIGVIYLWYRDSSRRFDEASISTLQGIANQAGGVISQARLYDSSQQHIAETEALRRIGETVLHSNSLDTTLDQIADVMSRMISHDYAFFGMIDKRSDTVVIQRIWGKFPDEVLHYRISIEESLTGEAIRTGTIVNLPDAFADPRMHRFKPVTLQIRSVLIAPLVTENGTVGVLYLAREDNAGFTHRQERLMALLCQQAAIAIERTQARDSLALHTQRRTLLANVTNLLISTPDPVDALPVIADEACGVLADGVAIALSSWEYGALTWTGGAHINPDAHSVLHSAIVSNNIPVNKDRVEQVLSAEEASLMPLNEGRPADHRELETKTVQILQQVNARQMLTVPMRQRGRAPGLLVLISSDPAHSLDEDLTELAQIIANRIGDALERRQMTLNREALLRLSEAINTHLEFDELLEMFIEELYRIVPYDQMYLGKYDPETGHTRPLTYLNPHGLSAEDVEMASNQGISGEVMRTHNAVLDNHAHLRDSSEYGSIKEAEFYGQHGESVIAAPLIAENSLIGILFVGRTGANRFSESDFETFLLFSGLAASALHRTELLQTNQLMYRASVEVLAAVVDAKDPMTLEHSRHVAHYARSVAEAAGLSASDVERIELAGLLHDVGKLSIPDYVLSKPGPLTDSERALINTHPERGASILNQHPALLDLVPLIRHHHERIDGSGYPDGLIGDQIPLGASIISVADAFDTMTSQRAYQRTRSIEEAIGELQVHAGTQFHAAMVELFVSAIRRDPELTRFAYGSGSG
jgi:putative nucleotidyltransferase with HDIG domain